MQAFDPTYNKSMGGSRRGDVFRRSQYWLVVNVEPPVWDLQTHFGALAAVEADTLKLHGWVHTDTDALHKVDIEAETSPDRIGLEWVMWRKASVTVIQYMVRVNDDNVWSPVWAGDVPPLEPDLCM